MSFVLILLFAANCAIQEAKEKSLELKTTVMYNAMKEKMRCKIRERYSLAAILIGFALAVSLAVELT